MDKLSILEEGGVRFVMIVKKGTKQKRKEKESILINHIGIDKEPITQPGRVPLR